MLLALCLLVYGNTYAQQYDAFKVKVTGKGQPVILIPGATCGGGEWDETVAHWNGKYQCHVLTLAGYAGVPPLQHGPYLDHIRQQVEQYITDNKLNNVILVGHSIGGVLSMWIAADMKEHLQKVVVVDAMPFYAMTQNPHAADTFSEKQAQGMYSRYSSMNDQQFRTSQRMMAGFMCLDSTRWNQIVEWGAQSDRKTMAYTMTEMMSKDLRRDIARINVPVLVLAAYSQMPQYPSFTREAVMDQFGDQYKACAKCTVHVAEGKTRHFVMYDNPQWYYKELDSFLQ